MTFAKWVFRAAGVYGLILLPPYYFLERQIGENDPPAITHPEYFYGFVGVAIAWQIAFLAISRDPARFRPLMPVASLEKGTFGIAAIALFAQQRISATVLSFALIDIALGAMFAVAYWTTEELGARSAERAAR